MTEERVTDWVAQIERLLPAVMRGLFTPPAEQSPLWNLPVPQLRAMHLLRRHGDLTMRVIAGHLGVAMSTATQVADRLEARGLVRRLDDPTDRRVVRLSLTDSGTLELAHLAEERRAGAEAAMMHLTESERAVVLSGLQLLEEAVRESAPLTLGRQPAWHLMTETAPPQEVERLGDD